MGPLGAHVRDLWRIRADSGVPREPRVRLPAARGSVFGALSKARHRPRHSPLLDHACRTDTLDCAHLGHRRYARAHAEHHAVLGDSGAAAQVAQGRANLREHRCCSRCGAVARCAFAPAAPQLWDSSARAGADCRPPPAVRVACSRSRAIWPQPRV
eukprot:Amastigsp_a341260_20.p2 type:complete len:156 gc:universal Amastigsp_a341260_20:658-1125(+)